MITTYTNEDADAPESVKGQYFLTSIRVDTRGGHDHVTLFSRGQNVGTLIFGGHEGLRFAEMLLGAFSGYTWRVHVTEGDEK